MMIMHASCRCVYYNIKYVFVVFVHDATFPLLTLLPLITDYY